MKKYIVYVVILVAGLLLGWLLFGSSSNEKNEHNHTEGLQVNQKWTCSMHPQIMQPEAGDCPICGMDLIPAESSTDGLALDQFKLTKNAMALANIQTSIVGNGKTDNNSIKLSGKIIENEEANVVQVSYFSGRIERLNISFTGEKVSKGQLLATIYSPELYAAQQELLTAASLKESQPTLYKAVRNKLKLWKLSESQINNIETSKKVKENLPIYATVSGTVSEKLVAQGDYIKQGQPLLKIANLSTVWANFDVYENQIDAFKKGQEVTVTTNTYANKEFKAKVDFIDPVLDNKTRTVKLRTVLKNKNNILKPGMFVEGEIKGITSSKEEVLTIPFTSVLWTGKRSVVYLKSKPNESVFELREVTLGNKSGNYYSVLEGLNDGDEIVTNGTFTVDAAAQLQGKKSMMNKASDKVMTGHEDHSENENTLKNNDRIKVSSNFQKQLNRVFNDYINLKDALVNDDSNNAKKQVKMLLSNLTKIDMKLLADDKAHMHWMNLDKEIKFYTNYIIKTSDIKDQREHFKSLSLYLTNAIEVFGVNEKVYHQFCPMANNNKGAYWLSKEKKVLNPYFGAAMLKCGEVKKVID